MAWLALGDGCPLLAGWELLHAGAMLWLATPILQLAVLHVLPSDLRKIGDAQSGDEIKMQKRRAVGLAG